MQNFTSYLPASTILEFPSNTIAKEFFGEKDSLCHTAHIHFSVAADFASGNQ